MTLSYLITENSLTANAMLQMHSRAKPLAICAEADLSSFSFAGISGSVFSIELLAVLTLEDGAAPLA